MASHTIEPVSLAFEGIADEAVARRLCHAVGLEPGISYPCRGKGDVDKRLAGFNAAAQHSPWLVLRDLDVDAECAAVLRARLLPESSPGMAFRIPVRMVESWLLADRVGISNYLGVSTALIPRNPDELDNPKRELVNLARRSKRRLIREDMVPARGTSSEVGPGYTSHLIDFVRDHWNIEAAARISDSLNRAVQHLRRLAEKT